jgi:hypothetical protein
MYVLFAANAAVKAAVPVVVMRHRSAGVLTWALLHQMESEVLAEVAATGKHSARMLDMLAVSRAGSKGRRQPGLRHDAVA